MASCTPPGIQDAEIDPPLTWKSAKNLDLDAPLIVDDSIEVEQEWWSHFGDETLDAIIQIALANNKTLGIAKTRIEEAYAARMLAISYILPQITVPADTSKGNQGFFTSGVPLAFRNAALQATWEIDLFGKNQERVFAADAILQSEVIARQAVIVSLLAELGRNYFDMRNFERQIAITQENLASQQKTLDLTKEQLKGGLSSNFDVQRAAAQVSVTAARLPELIIGYELSLNRLNVLLGAVPGQYDDLLKREQALKPIDPQILIAAPATVLGTRPDVRAAERRFAAAISENEAAKREWFPSINLLGFYGVQNMTLFNTAPTWNVQADLVQPIINFGRIESDILATDARKEREFLTFQETVLEALADMEDALTNYIFETKRNLSLTNAAEENRQAKALANEQYENGYTPLLDVLVVQRNVLETESVKAASDLKLRKDLVNIYTAAGGGWQVEIPAKADCD
ncbi:MAG: TolC family protein [Parachlamydiaceae bacterium]